METDAAPVADQPIEPAVHREWWAGWVLWPLAYLVTAVVFCLGVAAASLPGVNLGELFTAFLAGTIVAAVWVLCFLAAALNTRVRMSRRALARWLGIPVLGAICLALMLSGIPATVRFELSRAELDKAAARAESGQSVEPGWIGLIPIDSIESQGSETWFVVPGSGGFGPCALVHQAGTAQTVGRSVQNFGGGWWLACDYSD
jgi:hypothetical protein